MTGDTSRAIESVIFKRPVNVLQDLNFKWRAAEDSNSRRSALLTGRTRERWRNIWYHKAPILVVQRVDQKFADQMFCNAKLLEVATYSNAQSIQRSVPQNNA